MSVIGRKRHRPALWAGAALACGAFIALGVQSQHARALHAPEPSVASQAGEMVLPPTHLRSRHTELREAPPTKVAPAPAAQRFPQLAAIANIAVNDPTGEIWGAGNTQMEPSLAANGDTLVCGFTDSRGMYGSGSASGFAWSLNGGQTWVDGGSLPNPPSPMLVFGDPTVATDFQGRWYCLSALDRGNGPTQGSGGLSVVLHRGRFFGAVLSWDAPQIIAGNSTDRLDTAHLAVDPDRDRVYVSFTNVTQPAYMNGRIEVVTLDQHGTNELHRVVVQPHVAGVNHGGTRVAVGPDGEVFCAFEGGVNSGSDGQGPGTQKIVRSGDFGATFSPPVTAAAVIESWLSAPPGANREEESVEFPSLAVDRSNGPHRGRVYLVWHDAVYRTFTGALASVSETTSPNNAPQNAQVLPAYVPGVEGWSVSGGMWSSDVTDWYRFAGKAGDHMRMLVNPSNGLFELRLLLRWPNAVGTGADTTLAASWRRPGDQVFFLFTLPTDGDYYFALTRVGTSGGSYQAYLRRASAATASPAIDHRDVVIVSSPNGIDNWTPKVRVNTDTGSTDQAYPEVVIDAAGGVHVAWYDRHWDPRSRALADLAMASSFDGGATFTSPLRITGGSSWWQVSADVVPNFGDQFRPVTDGERLHMAWADGRSGDPDVLFAPLETGFDVALPESAQAVPGNTLDIAGTIHNRTPYDDAMFTVIVDPASTGLPDSILSIGPVAAGAVAGFDYAPVVGQEVQGAVNVEFTVQSTRSAVVRTHVVVAHNDAVAVRLHDFAATAEAGGVRLEWRSSPGAAFHVQRAPQRLGPFTMLTSAPVVVDAGGHAVFHDTAIAGGGVWFYRLLAAGDDGAMQTFGPYRVESVLPARLRLDGAVPNPFNPATEIRFALPHDALVTLRIVDARGRRVASLLDGERRKAGTHAVTWDGRDTHGVARASGVYWAELVASGERATTRLVLVR